MRKTHYIRFNKWHTTSVNYFVANVLHFLNLNGTVHGMRQRYEHVTYQYNWSWSDKSISTARAAASAPFSNFSTVASQTVRICTNTKMNAIKTNPSLRISRVGHCRPKLEGNGAVCAAVCAALAAWCSYHEQNNGATLEQHMILSTTNMMLDHESLGSLRNTRLLQCFFIAFRRRHSCRSLKPCQRFSKKS